MTDKEIVRLEIELSSSQAWALAQFCKRVGFRDFDNNAVDESEAYTMQSAQNKVYSALRDHGFNPR